MCFYKSTPKLLLRVPSSLYVLRIHTFKKIDVLDKSIEITFKYNFLNSASFFPPPV
jgi:hypothetical protein